MKLHLQGFKKRGTAPPILYKPDPAVEMKIESKADYLKVYIKAKSRRNRNWYINHLCPGV